jgi:hypothetical protein
MLILPTPLIVSSGSLILLLGDFGDLAQGQSAADGDRHHGRGAGVEFLDHRGIGALREIGQHPSDRVADLLGADVRVLLQHEGDDHLAQAFKARRAQLVDAGDRVDRLLDLLGERGFDLLGARAPQRRGDRHDG